MQQSALPLSQQPFLLSKAQQFAVLGVVFSYVLDAPLRFALGKLHASPAIYLRDAIAFLIVLAAFIHWAVGKKPNGSTFVGLVLVAHIFVGMLILGSIAQPLAGFKLFFIMLLGIACYDTLRQREKALHHIAAMVFGITCIGIFINWATDMPWSGETFDSAIGATQVSIEWTTAGIRRLSGFARASYDASTITVAACVPLLARANAGLLYRLAVLVIAFVAVSLTTTKGSLLALIVISIYAIFFIGSKKANKLNTLFLIAPILEIGIPFLLYAYDMRLEIDSGLWFLFSSFAERVNIAWPHAFDLFKVSGNVISGRGLGGIGFPQYFGEAARFCAADNAMVYLFVSFGAMSLIYIYLILMRLYKNAPTTPPYIWKCIIGWLIYWNIYGFTTNIIENPFFMFFMGLIVGAALSSYASKTSTFSPKSNALNFIPFPRHG